MDTKRRSLLLGASAAALSGMLLPRASLAQDTMPANKPLRILLLNPNSSDEFTALITREARRAGSPGTEFVGVSAPFGPRYIGTRTTVAIAGHAVVDSLARVLTKDRAFDAAIVCGFGAQGVPALRELAPFPVVGMLDASVAVALQLGSRFSVLTGGERWVAMLEEQLEAFGAGRRLASVRSIPLTGAEIAADQDRAIAALAELAETCACEDGADCVILGGAAVAGLPRRMADRVSVPLIDNVAVSVATAELLARHVELPPTARGRLPAIDSTGLSDELGGLIKPR